MAALTPERVGPYLWRIPPEARPGMRVPALIVADEPLIDAIRSDASLEQIANGATLPGIVKASLAMPDIHQGYGLPVGGVVATDAEHGVISPGAIGFDINCGVRLLGTELQAADVSDRMRALVDALAAADPERIESDGQLSGAVPDNVSTQAVERGRRQLGSLGAGNHFLEVQVVDEIYDAPTAEAFG